MGKIAACTERLKALADYVKEKFFEGYANVGYMDGVIYIPDVQPALVKFFEGVGFPPLEAEGPVAVLWTKTKVAVAAETGEINVLEDGIWGTYHF